MKYINLKPEEDSLHENNETLEKWPNDGCIEFIDVCLKYSENGDQMLKSLNIIINAGEKVAICGRTGAGKSSIVKAIFRLAQTTGTIKIDSIDISKIPLNILRTNLSIIPQDAALFSGTMRENLDPFNQHKDDELWIALEKVALNQFSTTTSNFNSRTFS